jgi:hypothetical protein
MSIDIFLLLAIFLRIWQTIFTTPKVLTYNENLVTPALLVVDQ